MGVLRDISDGIQERNRLKAVDLEQKKDFRRYFEGIQSGFGMMRKNQPAPQAINGQALINRNKHWVYICSSRNAAGVASVPLRLFAATGPRDQPVRSYCNPQRVTKERADMIRDDARLMLNPKIKQAINFDEIMVHPYLDLMANINPDMNGFDALEMTTLFQELTGDGYWLICKNGLGIPETIIVLPSQWVRPIPASNPGAGTIYAGYKFGRSNHSSVIFSPEEIIHFKYPNPNNIYHGLSPLEASLTAVDRYSGWDKYETSLILNDARPDMIVKYQGQLTEEQRRDLEMEWAQSLGGPGNAGKIKITDEDFEIKSMGFSPREMARLEGRKWTRLEIADAYGVPIALLDTEDVNRSNADVSLQIYQEYTIRPKLKRMEQRLNEKLLPLYDDRLFVMFDDPVASDRQLLQKQEEQDLKNAVRTINEIRNPRGMIDVPWGDVPLVPLNIAPLGTEPASAEPSPTAPNMLSMKSTVDVHPYSCECCDTKEQILPEVIFTGGENPKLTKVERDLIKRLKAFWADELPEIILALEAGAGITAVAALRKTKLAGKLADLMIIVLEGEMLKFGNIGLGEAGIELFPWIDQPEAIEFLQTEYIKIAENINNITADGLSTAIQDGISTGESIPQLTARVRGLLTGADADVRAARIARTESARATINGKRLAWKQSGVVEKVQWSAPDDACPLCQEIDGKTISINDVFFEKNAAPLEVTAGDRNIRLKFDFADVPGPPLHPNCRCDLVAVIEVPD